MADFVVGDGNSEIVGTLLRRDGTLFDLTGSIVRLRFRIGSQSHITAGMEILAPTTSGRVRYNFTPSDLNIPGILYAETEVVDPGTLEVLSSSDVLEFLVRDKVSSGTGAGLPTFAVEFRKGTNQVVVSGVPTKVTLDNVTYNVGGFPDPLDVGNGIFISAAGRYLVGGDVVWAPSAGGSAFLWLAVNGSVFADSGQPVVIGANGASNSIAITHTFNPNDIITLLVLHLAGADRTITSTAYGSPRLWAHNLA